MKAGIGGMRKIAISSIQVPSETSVGLAEVKFLSE